MRYVRLAVLGAAAVTAIPLVLLATAGPSGAAPTDPLPAVYPTPRSMQAHGTAVPLGATVGLVTGPDTDPAAVRVTREALTAAGVVRIEQTTDADRLSRNDTAVYLDGAGDALRSLGVGDATALPAEGYVLAAGRVAGRGLIAVDGHDATGTYYAAQTLRQLVSGRRGHASVPGVRVRDWPAYPLRGVIEGFYGTPWSHAARLDQLDFYGAHKLNTYVYSPKDDAYLRAKWRDDYPAEGLAQLRELTDRAKANHVRFTYALSPGLSVCYSSDADKKALVAKFQTLWDIGVRDFSVPLDDISYTDWNCTADETRFGTGGAAAGDAQAYLLNRVQADFIATHEGAAPLQMVPTEYSDTTSSGYKTQLKAKLDPAVVVEWTGVGVVAPVITTQQAAAAKAVFGHDILVWDNYPVNDYVPQRLLLGPYVGRDAGMTDSLHGITANPMIQPYASKLALFGVADFTWNDTGYDATASWQAGLTELAGGDRQARQALAAFADLEYSSDLDTTQAPVLAARLAAFWPAWKSGDTHASSALDAYLTVVETAPAVLRARLHDPGFAADTQPWLDSAGTWGQAGRSALRMLIAQRDGDGAAALAARAKTRTLATKAKSYRYVGLRGTVNVLVGDGVMDSFVNDALAENARWFGLSGHRPTATTSMPTYQVNGPANMVDGDDGTYFWSSRAATAGDTIGVDLGAAQRISAVTIHLGKSGSPADYLHTGTLEYSTDGETWTAAGTVDETPDVTVDLPADTTARYVRIRATAAQSNWVVVREFDVTRPDGRATVTGTPAAAEGSSLAAAADGDLDTRYTAAHAPASGDALTVALPKARPVATVRIAGSGDGVVEVSSNGRWLRLGTLRDGYTELDVDGSTVDAVRLTWRAGGTAPSIAEIAPTYTDDPTITVHNGR